MWRMRCERAKEGKGNASGKARSVTGCELMPVVSVNVCGYCYVNTRRRGYARGDLCARPAH